MDAKLIHIINRPDGGGAELLVRAMVERMRDEGIRVELWFLHNPRGLELRDHETVISNSGSVKSVFVFLRLTLHFARARRFLDKQGSVIHSHLTWPFLYAAILSLIFRINLAYTEHSTHNKKRDYSILRILDSFLYGRCRLIVCVSEPVYCALLQWLPKKQKSRICTIENGFEPLGYIERPLNRKSLRIAIVSSLKLHKGVDIALKAIGAIPELVERVDIVGAGSELGNLLDLCAELNINDVVKFHGYQDDIRPYVEGSNIGVVPSRWEGFGLVALELLSAGIPVVASDVPGMRDVLVTCDYVSFFESENSMDLADKLHNHHRMLVEGANIERRKMLQFTEQYSLEKMCKRYIAEYESNVCHLA